MDYVQVGGMDQAYFGGLQREKGDQTVVRTRSVVCYNSTDYLPRQNFTKYLSFSEQTFGYCCMPTRPIVLCRPTTPSVEYSVANASLSLGILSVIFDWRQAVRIRYMSVHVDVSQYRSSVRCCRRAACVLDVSQIAHFVFVISPLQSRADVNDQRVRPTTSILPTLVSQSIDHFVCVVELKNKRASSGQHSARCCC